MTYHGIVKNGAVQLPPDSGVPDGTSATIEVAGPGTLGDLLPLAGTWVGDDADEIIDLIYRSRSSAGPRASFD